MEKLQPKNSMGIFEPRGDVLRRVVWTTCQDPEQPKEKWGSDALWVDFLLAFFFGRIFFCGRFLRDANEKIRKVNFKVKLCYIFWAICPLCML